MACLIRLTSRCTCFTFCFFASLRPCSSLVSLLTASLLQADTPSKGPEEGSVQPVGSAFQGLAQPEAASPGTYAATATPFQGGSHSILAPTPSISGKPTLEEAEPGSGQGATGVGNNSLTATQPAADPQPVRFACVTQN